ncbi:MaoC family dehydratase [Streptomyces sp. NPDC096132]|uniref:MaoC family dehydratase n=1 Tax=Streptomyces sp. NPDC096132 TaxID=3366075 RepID=UPI003825F3EF
MTSTVTTIRSADEARSLIGVDLRPSDWLEVTAERIAAFADATGDHQWIHLDPVRAAAGPFGKPIAHGFLTLSLLPVLTPQIVRFDGFGMVVNYGTDRVRFPAPVPVGSRVRGTGRIESVTEVPGGIQVVMAVVIEIENNSKPACVVTSVSRYYL